MKLYLSTGKPSLYFQAEEFECRCYDKYEEGCHGIPDPLAANYGIAQALIDLLERIRTEVGYPIHLNCGFRCPDHNRAVGGVENSQHLLGRAADITAKNVPAPKLADLIDVKFNPPGLGRYNGFTHIDVRTGPRARWDNRR